MVDTIEVNGVTIAFTRRGKGPPLVLMHGQEADHSMFDALSERLEGDFTIVAYDQRDCGATINPEEPCTLADLADDAAALVAALGVSRAHIYGSSFGGLVAQFFAARFPDRVDRLVLGNTWRAGLSVQEVNPEGVARLVQLRGDLDANAQNIAELFFTPDFVRDNPSIVGMFRSNSRSPQKRGRRAALASQTMSADISTFPRPVLLLSGSEDRVIPHDATAALAEGVPRTQFALLDGVGHVGVIQAPDRVAEILKRFLLDQPQ
ncbi:alpha/beta fold hydrolase [Methylocapsa sp. S129]|uniref:alpha/beta fold hydrolase n=1 Tax=Methylocapsa sp. S129 TaxID=1641869 RepID=UPI00131AF7CE|nr:alpha/beta hydrolase [Methylocapsa sp. S129]